jgi:predicted ABC-type ATPase
MTDQTRTTRADRARQHATALGFDADALFQPNLAAQIDSTRTWVDDNGYRLSNRLWAAKEADRNAIDTVLREGLAAGDSVAGMSGRLREHLHPDTPGGNYAARRLARTETTRAFGHATLDAARENPFATGMKWNLSGSHTEPDACNGNASRSSRGMEKGTYTLDEVPRYPNHPNCLLGETLVHGPVPRASSARHFTGEIVEITIASGQRLAGTCHHPVLTPQGWIALDHLHKGDDLVRYTGHEGIPSRVDPYVDDVPARIDDVAVTLGEADAVTTRQMEVAPEDFHGDGASSEISVIRTNRDLMTDERSPRPQPVSKHDLDGRDAVSARLVGARYLDLRVERHRSTASSDIRGMRDALPLVAAETAVRETDRRRGIASLDASGEQSSGDRHASDAVARGERLLGLPIPVTFDQVVSVKRYPFSGHVYNLQTDEEWYIANSIIVHNCLCYLTPTMMTDAEFAAALANPPEDRTGMGDLPMGPFVKDFTKEANSASPFLVHYPDGSIAFTPERQALHDDIVRSFVEGVESSGEKRIQMLGGGPAAGKSSMIKSGAIPVDPPEARKAVLVNPDEVKELLPEYGPLKATDPQNAASWVHEESSYLSKRVQEAGMQEGKDILIDGVGVNYDRTVPLARERGYTVDGYYGFLPNVDDAIARSDARALKTQRTVPHDYIRERHSKVAEIFPDAASQMRSMALYDTSSTPRLIASADKGTLTIHDQAAYDHFQSLRGFKNDD